MTAIATRVRATNGGRPGPQPHERRASPSRPPLRIVGRARARRRVNVLGVLVVTVVFAVLFGAVVSSTWLVQGQQQLDSLNQSVADAQAQYEQLRLRVAELEAPDRIVAVATSRLGMVVPDETTYLVPPPVPPDDTMLVPPPAPADDPMVAAQSDWPEVKPYLSTAR